MIFLISLYLSLGSTFALPTPSDLPIDIPPSFFTHSADKFATRSLWSIIWSCFSTIFACSWIAVHPNIPGPEDSDWDVFLRRVAIMGYVLVAPEMVIWWALRQNLAARRLVKLYEKKHEWTMAHGFFIGMGGFTLHDEQHAPLQILEPQELKRLFESEEIAWPTITKKEIQDRSKGDYLSKTIVLVQTSWFVAQCIVRAAYRLEITELEVATLAFAVLTGVTYSLWWHKPLDVRCSVPVYKHSKKEPVTGTPQTTKSDESQTQSPIATPDPKSTPPEPNSTAIPAPNTRMSRFFTFVQEQQEEHGNFLGIAHAFLFHPFFKFFEALSNMGDDDTLNDLSSLRVPTFYAPRIDVNLMAENLNWAEYHFPLFVAICVAVVFGGIHCIAWSFHFPTLQERLAWRISAASVSGIPILMFAIYRLILKSFDISNDFIEEILDKAAPGVSVALVAIYVLARIALLVLPCIALRALRPTAFVEIQWTSFFPHIG